MGLRVLITNIELWPPSGTVLYVRDIALELQRQGHTPIVLSSTAGGVAAELRDAGIEVTASPGRPGEPPDIIHGHHYLPTRGAIRRWPTVPAIHVCHDHTSPHDTTPLHPNIRRHFGVSRVCVQRLVGDGVPEDRADLLLNFVDLTRFKPRTSLPERPRRALVFSNYAHEGSHLPAVREACRLAGLDLDVVGAGVDRIAIRPEELLGDYDIVFAKGRAAMEAMAVGTAVVLCDFSGVGPMVTSARFDELQPLNFGFEALRDPLGREPLLREIARYDPEDAAGVRDLLRSRAGLVVAVERLVAIYREAISGHRRELSYARPAVMASGSFRESLFLRLYWQWISLSPRRREALRRLPGIRVITRGVRRLLHQAG